jgi:hypothetical protein
VPSYTLFDVFFDGDYEFDIIFGEKCKQKLQIEKHEPVLPKNEEYHCVDTADIFLQDKTRCIRNSRLSCICDYNISLVHGFLAEICPTIFLPYNWVPQMGPVSADFINIKDV